MFQGQRRGTRVAGESENSRNRQKAEQDPRSDCSPLSSSARCDCDPEERDEKQNRIKLSGSD